MGDAPTGVPLQEAEHVVGAAAGVEGPPQGRLAEAVDARGPLRLDVGEQVELAAHGHRRLAGDHRGQVGLDQEVVDGRRCEPSERGDGIVGSAGQDRPSGARQGAVGGHAEDDGLVEHPADQHRRRRRSTAPSGRAVPLDLVANLSRLDGVARR